MSIHNERSFPSLMQAATGALALAATLGEGVTSAGADTPLAMRGGLRAAGRRHRFRRHVPAVNMVEVPHTCQGAGTHDKVALMILSRGALPHEPAWNAWFKSAGGLAPHNAGASLRCDTQPPPPVPCAPDDTIANQDLFSVYVHTAPDFVFAPDALFAKHQVADRVAASWGQHALIDAERALVQVALAEPRNQRMLLLSESDMPLYPPGALYQQLMHEEKSRVNACFFEGSDVWRWHPAMQRGETAIVQSAWRKSPQWVTLTREHAQVFADDTAVDAVFRQHCEHRDYDPELGQGYHCYSDEHYIPVLLSHAQLGHQTDCVGGVASADWSRGGASPYTYGPDDVNAALFARLRGDTCNSQAAIAAGGQMFVTSEQQVDPCAPIPVWNSEWLHARCSLFARKFAPTTTDTLVDLVTDCDNGLNFTACT